jgi:hypothetical protein
VCKLPAGPRRSLAAESLALSTYVRVQTESADNPYCLLDGIKSFLASVSTVSEENLRCCLIPQNETKRRVGEERRFVTHHICQKKSRCPQNCPIDRTDWLESDESSVDRLFVTLHALLLYHASADGLCDRPPRAYGSVLAVTWPIGDL